MSLPSENSPHKTLWLVVPITALPLIVALPLDFDRSVMLFFLPALWFGRRDLRSAWTRLSAWPVGLRIALSVLGCATVLSVTGSAHPAPALVTAASWVLLAAIGLMAGEMFAQDRKSGLWMLTGITGGAALGTVTMWVLWILTGRESLPLYAHHRIYGLHMISGAVASIGLLMQAWPERRQRRLWLIVGVIVWAGLLWSGGRAPVLAVFTGLFVWGWLGPSSQRVQLARTSALLLAGGLMLSAAMWTNRPELGWWHAWHRTTSAAQVADLNALTSTRTTFWQEASQRALQHPWFGHGPDAYRFITPKLDGQQPHNFVLQLWLDLGFTGTLPALVLLGGLVIAAARRATETQRPVWLALLMASLAAGLLDGIFYHLLAFLPAALALGTTVSAVASAPGSHRAPSLILPGQILIFAAVALLTLHSLLFYTLAVAPPPRDPQARSARLLRVFPSSTFGLWRWLDRWQSDDPATTLAWAQWAQEHSVNPPLFHIYAAQLLLAEGDRQRAESELRSAQAKSHWSIRPQITRILRDHGFPADVSTHPAP
jgi:O-antigen ligase